MPDEAVRHINPGSVAATFQPPPPRWAWSWARTLAGAEPLSSTRVPSNEVNEVYRISFDPMDLGGGALFLKVGPRLKPE